MPNQANSQECPLCQKQQHCCACLGEALEMRLETQSPDVFDAMRRAPAKRIAPMKQSAPQMGISESKAAWGGQKSKNTSEDFQGSIESAEATIHMPVQAIASPSRAQWFAEADEADGSILQNAPQEELSDDVAFSKKALELSEQAELRTKKAAQQPGLGRARFLSIPDPSKNKPAAPLVASSAKEALAMAARARSNPWSPKSWRKPIGARRAWAYGVAAVVLSASLAAQFGWGFKEKWSAQSAWAMAAFSSACKPMGCKIGLPKLPESVELEGADVRLDSEGNLVFTGSLKSTGAYMSSAPGLYLAIEDEQGALIASKVFSSKEWVSADSIAPGEALEAKMSLSVLPRAAGGFKAKLDWSFQ